MRHTPPVSAFLLAVLTLTTFQAQGSSGHYTQKQIENMVSTAVHIQIKAMENDHSVFLHHDHDVQPGKNKYAIVVQTVSHGSIHRITRLNGKAIPLSRQKSQVAHFVHSPKLQQKQHQNDQHDAKQVKQLLRMIPKAFLWSVQKQSQKDITLAYKPNPNFNPPNKEDRVFAAMAGQMVLDRKDHRIVSFQGKIIHNVNFFFGLLGRMDKGGTFSVHRRQLQPHVWETVATHTHIQGHILLFKTINQNENEHDTAFKSVPANLTLQQAAKLAMKQPDWPNSSTAKSSH